MAREDFQWGPWAQGIYRAMLWATVPVGFGYPKLLFYYVPLLLFLPLCLKPLLVKTGIHDVFTSIMERIHEKRWRKVTEQQRKEIERKQRDDKYRGRRRQDPRLPKNW